MDPYPLKSEWDRWLIRKLFEPAAAYGIVAKSYEHFIDKQIDMMLAEFSKKPLHRQKTTHEQAEYYLEFGKSRIELKDLGNRQEPLASKILREASTSVGLNVPVALVKVQGGVSTILVPARQYRLCDIPLLHHSKYDLAHQGQSPSPPYFVLNGRAKILTNQLLHKGVVPKITIKKDKGTIVGLSYQTYMRGISEEYQYRKPLLYLVRGGFRQNLIHVLRYLGTNAAEMLAMVRDSDPLPMLAMIQATYSMSDAELHQSLCTTLGVEESQLSSQLLRTLGHQNLQDAKLAHMETARNIVELLAGRAPSRYLDHMAVKRVLPCGGTLAKAFSEGLNQFHNKIRTPLINELSAILRTKSLVHIIRPQIITRYLRKCLIGTINDQAEPLHRPLCTINSLESIADLRKIVTPLNKNLAHEGYRQFNPSQVGRICPSHTPHSRSTGLVESLAMGARITLPFSQQQTALVQEILHQMQLQSVNVANSACVILDDVLMGYTQAPLMDWVHIIKKKRKNTPIGVNISDGKLYIRTSPGRIQKLCLRIEGGKIPYYQLKRDQAEALTLERLEAKRIIEYLDADQQHEAKIALQLDELHQSEYYYLGNTLSYSYTMAYVPAANNNSGHRASLTLRFIGQALGQTTASDSPGITLREEYLVRAEPSLVRTPYECLYSQKLGANILTAIGTHKDYTCQDAVVMNLNAIERGMLDYIKLKRDKIMLSSDQKGGYHLDESPRSLEGLPRIGSRYDLDEPVIKTLQDTHTRTESVGPGAEYRVEAITLAKIKRDLKISTTFKTYRNITIGQKIASRQGQKGTVGGIIAQYNLPVATTGHAPGLLISPNVFNSRMTIGPLSQMILSKVAILRGRPIELDVIEPDCLDVLTRAADQLRQAGLDSRGYDDTIWYGCYNPRLYMGLMKILLLQHHAIDKAHRRRKGAINLLTRQPVGGGKRLNGGLRFGQMERDAALAHGVPQLLNQRLTPDTTQVVVCRSCRVVLNDDRRLQGTDHCTVCKDARITRMRIPYALLVLIRTLRGASIQTHLNTAEDQNQDECDQRLPDQLTKMYQQDEQ